jgi:hypothetical protein
VSGVSPQEVAAELAAAVSGETDVDPVAGWLAVYEQLGLPVIGPDGAGIGPTDDDPIGPAYDMVWMLAPTSTLPAGAALTDLVRAYLDDGTPSEGLADGLLADLRADTASTDPRLALFGNFVRERALRTGLGSDLLDLETVAADVSVDAATAQLISWAVIRGMTAIAASGGSDVVGFRSPARTAEAVRAQPPATTPCSQIWGDEDTTYWVNWFANKIGTGTQLPGMEAATKGLLEKIAELNPGILSPTTADRVNKVGKVTNVVTGLLSLILSVSSLDVDAVQDPDPFERNKKILQGRGKSTVITWVVRIDIGNLPDGNNRLICAASFLLNTMGVGFSLPSSAVLEGVDVRFLGRQGFGERLNTAGAYVELDANELTMTSGPGGQIRTTVTGKAQRRDFPDRSKEIIREFSIDVSAQVEPENLNSLLNIFFDGLTFGVSPDGYGIAAGAIDIARTLHWDMGEYVFRMIDWQAGWKIDQNSEGYHFTGVVCDLEQEFTIDATSALAGAGGVGAFTVTPTSEATASWSFTGSFGGVFTYGGSGAGEIQTAQNAEPVVRLQASSNWVANSPAGPGPMGEHLPTVDLLLQPLDTDECTAG